LNNVGSIRSGVLLIICLSCVLGCDFTLPPPDLQGFEVPNLKRDEKIEKSIKDKYHLESISVTRQLSFLISIIINNSAVNNYPANEKEKAVRQISYDAMNLCDNKQLIKSINVVLFQTETSTLYINRKFKGVYSYDVNNGEMILKDNYDCEKVPCP